MQLIAVEKPASVSKLAELSGRTQSNVSRALQDLAKHGLVRLIRDGMTVRPVLAAVEVDVNLVNGTCEIIPVATAAE
jgi:predicted transcriptional regulator